MIQCMTASAQRHATEPHLQTTACPQARLEPQTTLCKFATCCPLSRHSASSSCLQQLYAPLHDDQTMQADCASSLHVIHAYMCCMQATKCKMMQGYTRQDASAAEPSKAALYAALHMAHEHKRVQDCPTSIQRRHRKPQPSRLTPTMF